MDKIFRYSIRAYMVEGGSVRPAEDWEISRDHKDYAIDVIQGEHADNADALFEMTRMELITSRALTSEELGTLNRFLTSQEFAKFYRSGAKVPHFLIHCLPSTSAQSVRY